MRYILIILTTLLLTSCGSYRIQQRGPEITHVLALTKEGDTLKVPIQDLQRDLTPDYYSGYRFYWNNSWWMYNDWYWNYWYQNPRWFYPRYQIRIPRNRVRVQTPRYTPQRNQSVIRGNRSSNLRAQPNRGRSNQQKRTPQYNRPTRTQSTPNVIQRPTRTRSGSGRGTSNNVRRIKQ